MPLTDGLAAVEGPRSAGAAERGVGQRLPRDPTGREHPEGRSIYKRTHGPWARLGKYSLQGTMGVVLDGWTLVAKTPMQGKDSERHTMPGRRQWARRALTSAVPLLWRHALHRAYEFLLDHKATSVPARGRELLKSHFLQLSGFSTTVSVVSVSPYLRTRTLESPKV
jgi:hypothetical protein